MDAVREAARALVEEADETNERRLLVLTGGRQSGYDAARVASETVDCEPTVISERDGIGVSGWTLPPNRAGQLLGTTQECVVVDCHDTCRPNALGRATGAVDGGGLLVFLTPPLDEWPGQTGAFDETLAVPPFGLEDVSALFRQRLVETLRSHRGIAIVDVDVGAVRKNGLTHPPPRRVDAEFELPAEPTFPRAVFEGCLTGDQRDAVSACERLHESGNAVVLEADRGRGKSSAAGLAAAGLAAEGRDVLVSAPNYRSTAELFARATETLDELDALESDARGDSGPTDIRAMGGGRIRFRRPPEALGESADALIVDEAAALPVRVLQELLDTAPSVCFATTVHGYEGAGRGFDVRFRSHLEDAFEVTTCTLAEPIRYAPADPIEVWLFRALLLDASPPVEEVVESTTPDAVEYERLDTETLVDDERRLREVFGLLVNAHYRTEPDDLARLLDAPNLAVRALTHDGHVVAVALLAREGGLPATTRESIYEGTRVRGNMIPDVLTSQIRDIDAAVPVGLRVMRIATHHAVRSRGLGSHLIAAIEAEFDAGGARSPLGCFEPVDYLGVGYGATPELLSFWQTNGYETVHLSTTRNDTSGEYSAVMLRPLSSAGQALADRHARWFCRRIPDVLADALDDADPDVVRAGLRAAAERVSLSLTDDEWRLVASAAFGPGLFDIAPGGFRQLAVRALVDDAIENADDERLLVVKVLQARPWNETADELGYVSERECMRRLGEAFQPLVERYGNEVARQEADRYR